MWLVECDDERWRYSTRAAAREFAGRLNRHPGNVDIKTHGPYRNVDGRARVRREATPPRARGYERAASPEEQDHV